MVVAGPRTAGAVHECDTHTTCFVGVRSRVSNVPRLQLVLTTNVAIGQPPGLLQVGEAVAGHAGRG